MNEEVKTEPEDKGQIVFEISIASSATTWPEACAGAAKVAEAFQKMLEGAANGNIDDFEQGLYDMDAAGRKWNEELFAVEEDGK